MSQPAPAPYRGELAFALALADLADGISLPAWHDRVAGERPVEIKSDGTWVTATDREVERTLRSAIAERYPDHAVLGEEDGLQGPAGAPTWIIDPIDGTTNFVKGNPVWATLIALRVDGREVVGVASAPALGSRWDGVAGGPARRDSRQIKVSTVSDLGEAEVALGGLGYFAEGGDDGFLQRVATRTGRQRGYGDFWQHCLVANGSTDVAMEAAVSPWDLAAVRVIVEAAGGRFTDLDGQATVEGGSACSSNGLLHDQALALLRG